MINKKAIHFLWNNLIQILLYLIFLFTTLIISLIIMSGFKHSTFIIVLIMLDLFSIIYLLFERKINLYIIDSVLYQDLDFDKYIDCLEYIRNTGNGIVKEINNRKYLLGSAEVHIWRGDFEKAKDIIDMLNFPDNAKEGYYYNRDLLAYYERLFLINVFTSRYAEAKAVLPTIKDVKFQSKNRDKTLEKLNAVYRIIVDKKSDDYFLNNIFKRKLDKLFYNKYVMAYSYLNRGDTQNYNILKSDLLKEDEKLFFVKEMIEERQM